MSAELPEMLTVEDLANYLRVSKRTVMLMAQSRELPMFKVTNRWRIRRETFIEWVEAEEARWGQQFYRRKPGGQPGERKRK